MSNEPDETTREEELVITPGGPRPKDRVHAVGPGEAVYVDESGNARVIPRTQEGETVNRAQDMIVTPGGLRHKSLVHLIEPGHVLDGTGGHHRKLDPSGKAVADFGLIAPRPGNAPLMPGNVARPSAEIAPAFGSGWIAYTDWSNTTGNPISSFSTTWTVPPAPVTQSGQLLYLFNGIQNSTMIYQPVLQWGNNGAFGGNYWLVASWYADGQGGQAFYSQNTQVNPGDILVGVMTLTGQSGASFSYNCQFQGIANSGLPIQNVQQLTWSVETLEVYGITQCSDYPDTDILAFREINIQTGNSTPTLTWSPVNAVTDCGYRAIAASNANPAGEVDLVSWLQVPSPAIVTSLTRYRDHIDLFVTGLEGGVYSTFWDVSSGWFNYWFRLTDPAFGDSFTMPQGAPITPLTRFQNHIDLFVAGRDGGVYSTFWDASSGWFNHWFRLTDPAFGDGFTIPPDSNVTALSRFQDHIDLFVAGRDGGVYSTFWDANGGWFNHWFRLTDPAFGDNFTVPPQSTVSALSRFQNHLDLFVVGRDGGIYSTFWDANGGWFNHWFRLTDPAFGDQFTVVPQSTVTALSRFQDHIDLFVVGRDGGVYSTFWDASSGWFNHWFRLTDPAFGDGFTVPPQSTVSALSRFQNHLDLFVVGRDGGIYSTFWDANGGWFNHWFRLTDPAFGDNFTVPPGSTISAMSRFQDHIDLFVVGRDGGIYSTFWDANSGWFNHWFHL